MKNRAWFWPTTAVAGLCFAGIAAILAARAADPYNVGLARHEARWRYRKPRHYGYTAQFGGADVRCFAGPVRVEVRDDVPVKVQPVDSRRSYTPGSFGEVSTIDRLFECIRKTLVEKHDRIEMAYDPKWGFPAQAMMAENITEGDIEIQITEFTVLP